jgi:hypothetical protein
MPLVAVLHSITPTKKEDKACLLSCQLHAQHTHTSHVEPEQSPLGHTLRSLQQLSGNR